MRHSSLFTVYVKSMDDYETQQSTFYVKSMDDYETQQSVYGLCKVYGRLWDTAVCLRFFVKQLHWLLWFLKVTWLNTAPERGTKVLEHVGVAIL
jgi:hypothetical protein